MGSFVRLLFWLQAISKVKSALHGYKNCRWNDLEMMTMFTHTGTHINWFAPSWSNYSTPGEIENFNSLMNKYCPKMYAFRYFNMIRPLWYFTTVFCSHASMFVRSALAAIDHNLNTGREQKTTAQGTLCFDLVKTRHAKKYQVKAVKVAKDTFWRNGLASLTVKVYKS